MKTNSPIGNPQITQITQIFGHMSAPASSSTRTPRSAPVSRPRPRGMILLLVIAILVLLAMLGTAYILMARADKHSTYAANAAANMGLAQKGVLSIVRNTMLNQTLDGAMNGTTPAPDVLANAGYYVSGMSYPAGAVVEFAPDFNTTYATRYYENTSGAPNNTSPIGGSGWVQITGSRDYDYPQATNTPSLASTGGESAWSTGSGSPIFQAVSMSPGSPPPTGSAANWQQTQGESWLLPALPWEANTDYLYGQEVVYDGQSYFCLTPPGTSPPGTADWQAEGTLLGTASPSAQVNYYTMLTPYGYDPSTGGYDVTVTYADMFGFDTADAPPKWIGATASVVQPSVVASALNTSKSYPYGTRDAIWQMLPYSSPNGTRYRFALCVTDSNSMLNLNAGSASNTLNQYAGSPPTASPSGYYFNGAALNGSYFNNAGTPEALLASTDNVAYIVNGNGSTLGRGGGTVGSPVVPATNLAQWANELFTYQAPQVPGVQWYSLATELELRSYGNSGGGFNGGTSYNGRPLQLWPSTLGYPSGLAAANRAFYTTYSWDRSYRRIGDIYVSGMPLTLNGSYTCDSPTGTAGENVWPTFPQKIWVNEPSVATSSANMANTTAKTATDLARVLLSCGYSGPEAVAFAANYMNYMYDAGTFNSAETPNGYRLGDSLGNIVGPSFVDSQGICVRNASGGTADDVQFVGAGDLTSALAAGFTLPVGVTQADLIVGGYAAQPFIVEAAVNASVSGATVTYNECAVELYNPYGTALDVGGWEIGVLNATGTAYNTTYTIPAGTVIPANGYLAIQSGAATPAFTFEGSPPAALPATTTTLAFTSTAGTACDAVLLRPFVLPAAPQTPPPPGTSPYLPVDEFNVAPFEPVLVAGNYYLSRYAATYVANDHWGCANATETPVEPVALPVPPTNSSLTFPAIPLYDRFADQSDVLNTAIAPTGDLPGYVVGTKPAAGAPLLNIADFNRITRLISVSALSGTVYVPIQMISTTIADLTKNSAESNANLQFEANARFDFLQPANAAPPDPRALDILKMITMVNPACDPDFNSNSATLNAIRMAGRLNVNTASLPALENMFVSVGDSSNAVALADLILGCRDRTGAFVDGTSTGNVGSGICSMGQLLYALNDGSTAATTMDNRDWTWATIYNMTTVRSDTFVVYGLIQALHLNQNYTPSGGTPGTLPVTANTTDWYTANQAGLAFDGKTAVPLISTDPDNTNAEFIMEGQRRFVAIIDRSYSNIGPSNALFQLPKVVALKVLPN